MVKERIIVDKISKKFGIGYRRNDSALAKILELITEKNRKKILNVLDEISFTAKEKEVIGIIGKNGSGKSTLIRIIAKIYSPNKGKIKTNGKLIYLNGFNTGLRERLTMRENIFLMGSVLGLAKKEINKRFEEIVNFSGLKEFVDTKIYQFSDGMIARLSFSITFFCISHSKPEILLLDEVFGAGGDKEFTEKALKEMERLIKSNATVLLVSHDLDIIKKYCTRVLWLEKGKIKEEGDVKKIVDKYIKDG